MNRRVTSEEYEEHSPWYGKIPGIGKILSPEPEEDEEEEFQFESPAAPTRNQRRAAEGNVLRVHANRGSLISKRAPRCLADAERCAEDLKERRPVIVNLEKTDPAVARRVIDFISGVTYALNGVYQRVGEGVFLFTPSGIIISDEDEVEPGGKGLYADDDYER